MSMCDEDSDLHWACWDADQDELERLLACGDNINVVADDGGTPLMRACEANAVACAQLCLSAGAVVNACDDHGRTALHYAWASGGPGSAELAEALLARGGRGCIHHSCQKCRMKHKLLARQAARRQEAAAPPQRQGVGLTAEAAGPVDSCSPASPPSSPTSRTLPNQNKATAKKKAKRRRQQQSKSLAAAALTDSSTTGVAAPSRQCEFSAKTMKVFAEEFAGRSSSVEALLASFRNEDEAFSRRAARCA